MGASGVTSLPQRDRVLAEGARISDSRPFVKNAKERGTHCVVNARKIKSLGHPPMGTNVFSRGWTCERAGG
jgi:hypothetical protein